MASLKDIAARTGLSYQTVAQVLGGNEKRRRLFSKTTQELVLRTADELGYRPNMAARAVSTGRFGAIALVSGVDSRQSSVFEKMYRGIYDALDEHDLHLNLARLSDRALTDEAFVPKLLRQWSVDGLLVNYTHRNPGEFDVLIEQYRLPAVWLNRDLPRNAVYPDETGGASLLAKRVIECGHRRTMFLSVLHDDTFWPTLHSSAHQRRDAWLTAIRDAGLVPAAHISKGPRPKQPAYIDEACEILRRPDRPTAICCHSEFDASTVFAAAKMLGIRVPQELSIVVVARETDEVEHFADYTGVSVDRYAIGRLGVEMLVKRIEDPETPLLTKRAGVVIHEGCTLVRPSM